MVVEHSTDHDGAFEKGFYFGVPHIHGMLGNYHYARVDDKHILLIGTYSLQHHNTLHNMDTVSVLPMLSSVKAVKTHGQVKGHHWRALCDGMSLADDSIMEDVLYRAEILYGPVFTSEI